MAARRWAPLSALKTSPVASLNGMTLVIKLWLCPRPCRVRQTACLASQKKSMRILIHASWILASTGEQVSVALLAIALQSIGKEAVSYTGWQVPIMTDSAYTKSRIQSIDDVKVKKDLDAGKVVVITGFQGMDADGNITTLGRGGSDTSAVAVAAALKAAECLIYTDVDGVYTTDPRVVSEARRLKTVTFEEMLEMASLGSKVLQIRSVEFAGNYRMPTRVLSSSTGLASKAGWSG